MARPHSYKLYAIAQDTRPVLNGQDESCAAAVQVNMAKPSLGSDKAARLIAQGEKSRGDRFFAGPHFVPAPHRGPPPTAARPPPRPAPHRGPPPTAIETGE